MATKVEDLLAALKVERDALAAKSQPLRDKRTSLQSQVAALEGPIIDLSEQIRTVEGDELFKLDRQIGQLTKALGARSLSAGSSTTPTQVPDTVAVVPATDMPAPTPAA